MTNTVHNLLTASTFEIKVSSAKMPGSCWGRYQHVAVMEMTPGYTPSMISERARGCRGLCATWMRQNVGKTSRSAALSARADAAELVEQLYAAQAIGFALQALASITA